MKLFNAACAAALFLMVAAPAAAYETYEFKAYQGEEDALFPTFTLTTGDFLRDPDPALFTATRFFSATELQTSSNVASVEFSWGGTLCCGQTQRRPYVTIYQRFAYPGSNRFGGFIQTTSPGESGNGAFLWRVTSAPGEPPLAAGTIASLQPPPGLWETPIGGTVQIDPTPVTPPAAVPEPASWALLIIGFALTGTFARRQPLTRSRLLPSVSGL
jgi:hypothetical protein